MCDKIKMDKVRNEDIRSLVGVTPIEDKMREHRLRWFGHVGRRPIDALVRRVEKIDIEQGKKIEGDTKNDLVGGDNKRYEIIKIEREDGD